MTITLGNTYSRKVGDTTESVTLDRICDWGGWYGTDKAGNTVRVTEKSLITNVQEDTNMATPATRVTAADRRARRAANGNTVTDTTKAVEEAIEPTKPVAKAAPKRKPAAKSTPTVTVSNTNNEESNIMPVTKPASRARKSPAKPVATATPVVTDDVAAMEARIVEMAAKMAAKMVAEAMAANAPTEEPEAEVKPTATRRRNTKSVAAKSGANKALLVTLKSNLDGERKNSWYFKFGGTSKTPLVTGTYVSKDAIESLENGETTVTAIFDRADGKKHSILFREQDGSKVFNGSLYVMRNALKDSGITESTPIIVTLTVKSDDEITLSIVAA